MVGHGRCGLNEISIGSTLRQDDRKVPFFPGATFLRSDVSWSDTARDATVSLPSGTELFVAMRDKFSLRILGRSATRFSRRRRREKSLCGVAAR